MLQTRVIPCLLLKEESLVKTVKFDKYNYIGDPINTVRIFNELEVDELLFLDINSTTTNKPINFKILSEIADECFMPLGYGGGIRTVEDIKKIFSIGLEKVAINSYATEDPDFISRAADLYGSQSIIGSMDVKKNFWGKYEVFTQAGKKKFKKDPVEWAIELEKKGAGELLITSIDRDGTWKGYDVDLVKSITSEVSIPVIASGGAGSLQHLKEVVHQGNASAVALGSMVVYQKEGLGVLINFPSRNELEETLTKK
jgi:cyclase